MTTAPPQPEWSVQDARDARALAEARHGAARRLFGPMLANATAATTRITAAVAGPQVYRPRLETVARHMNRNSDAFDTYVPRQGDVVVSAYFKAGTNWIMHVCHQICHLGRAEFDHIQDVIPWPDAAEPRFWINVNDDTPRRSATGLRVIKSHLHATRIPINAQARYIAVTRDPKDCAASAYHFFRALVFGATMPPPDVWLHFFRSETPNFGRWDTFTSAWDDLRDQPEVLFLCFEDVKRDNKGAIRRIAAFMGVELTEEQFDLIVNATSIDAMKQINHKFYPARQTRHTDPQGKIIRKGGVGDARGLFSSDDLAHFDQHWIESLTAMGSDFPYAARYGTDKNRMKLT